MPSQRSKYTEGVALRMRICIAVQRLSRKCVQKKKYARSVMSIIVLHVTRPRYSLHGVARSFPRTESPGGDNILRTKALPGQRATYTDTENNDTVHKLQTDRPIR